MARRLCRMWHVPLPHHDLAYLPEGADTYLRDLRWAQAFAAANRAEMADRVVAGPVKWADTDIAAEETVNCHRDHTGRERHFGRDRWLTGRARSMPRPAGEA